MLRDFRPVLPVRRVPDVIESAALAVRAADDPELSAEKYATVIRPRRPAGSRGNDRPAAFRVGGAIDFGGDRRSVLPSREPHLVAVAAVEDRAGGVRTGSPWSAGTDRPPGRPLE